MKSLWFFVTSSPFVRSVLFINFKYPQICSLRKSGTLCPTWCAKHKLEVFLFWTCADPPNNLTDWLTNWLNEMCKCATLDGIPMTSNLGTMHRDHFPYYSASKCNFLIKWETLVLATKRLFEGYPALSYPLQLEQSRHCTSLLMWYTKFGTFQRSTSGSYQKVVSSRFQWKKQ